MRLGSYVDGCAAVARGINDLAADPASVFVYRGETCEVAEQLGVDCSKFRGPIVPVVYEVNFRDPAGYFLATKFEMRSKDVIFVSNAVSVEMTKAMNLFRTVVGTVNDPLTAAINVYVLKAALKSPVATTTVVGGATVGP